MIVTDIADVACQFDEYSVPTKFIITVWLCKRVAINNMAGGGVGQLEITE